MPFFLLDPLHSLGRRGCTVVRLSVLILTLLLALAGCGMPQPEAPVVPTAAPAAVEPNWQTLLGACAHGVGVSGTASVTDSRFAAAFMDALAKQGYFGRCEDYVSAFPRESEVQPLSHEEGRLYAFRTDSPCRDNADGTFTQWGVLLTITPQGVEEGEAYEVTALLAPDKPLGLLLLRVEKVQTGT